MLEVVEFRKRGLPTFAEIQTPSRAGGSIVLPRFFAYFFIMEKVRDAKENAGLLKEFRFPKLKILAFLLEIRVVLPSR